MLCLSVCFVSLASCGKEPPAEDSTAASGEETAISESLQNTGGTGRLSLPYVKGDSLNPFSAKSLPNQLLSTVLYDSLYSVDAALSPQPFLATSGSVSGTQVRVALAGGLGVCGGGCVCAGVGGRGILEAGGSAAGVGGSGMGVGERYVGRGSWGRGGRGAGRPRSRRGRGPSRWSVERGRGGGGVGGRCAVGALGRG